MKSDSYDWPDLSSLIHSRNYNDYAVFSEGYRLWFTGFWVSGFGFQVKIIQNLMKEVIVRKSVQ